MDVNFRTSSVDVELRLDGDIPEYTDEGFRIFRNVKIARAGLFDYFAGELKKDGFFNHFPKARNHEKTKLYRPPEAFTPKVLASCVGKPVCNNHPGAKDNFLITPENFKELGIGSMGSNPHFEDNWLKIDLIIYDKNALNEINNGKIEVSIGYIYKKPVEFVTDKDYCAEDWITYINHVAIVNRGRAGPEGRLNEEKELEEMANENENMQARMNDIADAIKSISDSQHEQNGIIANLVGRLNAAEEEAKKKEKESKEKESKDKDAAHKDKAACDDDKDSKMDSADDTRQHDMFYMKGPDLVSLFKGVSDQGLIGWFNGVAKTGKDHTSLGNLVKGELASRQHRRQMFDDQPLPNQNQPSVSADKDILMF